MTAIDDKDNAMMLATYRNGVRAQRGVALIVGLVILAILSLIGIAAFTITTQEERMAGNSRDRILAFEAAEAALRGCESFLATNGTTAFSSTNPGMYTLSQGGQPITETPAAQSESWWQAPSTTVLSVPVSGSSNPPACVAESITLYPNAGYTVGNPLSSGPKAPGPNAVNVAHITAHGYGLNPNTVVRLESYYSL